MPLKDNDPMPFGKHKGKKMANVPDQYLKWFWNTNIDLYVKNSPNLSLDGHSVMDYIRDYGIENLK